MRRNGRITKSQQKALDLYWKKYGIDFNDSFIKPESIFTRQAPIVMDIGVGYGENTLNHAKHYLDNDYLAIDVHLPSIGYLIKQIEINNIKNIRIINNDALLVLKHQIPDHIISQCFIFFPDPWPKKRHNKRRLINPSLLNLLKNKLCWHGRLHIATDCIKYAEHINKIINNEPCFINLAGRNNLSPRPTWRVNTRYENRGNKLNHEIYDFCFGLNLK